MEPIEESIQLKYRFGVILRKWNQPSFGLTFNFHKIEKFNTFHIDIDLGKTNITIGWCEISENCIILL